VEFFKLAKEALALSTNHRNDYFGNATSFSTRLIAVCPVYLYPFLIK